MSDYKEHFYDGAFLGFIDAPRKLCLDLALFSALPPSLSFPVVTVDAALMISNGPSRALRRLNPDAAIVPPSLLILNFNFLVISPNGNMHASDESSFTGNNQHLIRQCAPTEE
jgi:hypothetical protein